MAKQYRIVIIEDEPHLQEELTAAFTEQGFEVKNAYDGVKGLELVMHEKPDAVLLDLILPKKDGFGILEAIKANKETQLIPVIILSNLEMTENVERAIRLGATSYLVKPNYDVTHITEKVKNILDNA